MFSIQLYLELEFSMKDDKVIEKKYILSHEKKGLYIESIVT